MCHSFFRYGTEWTLSTVIRVSCIAHAIDADQHMLFGQTSGFAMIAGRHRSAVLYGIIQNSFHVTGAQTRSLPPYSECPSAFTLS